MISTVSYDQQEIIRNIITLYCPGGIEADVTYSRGVFYKGKEAPAEPLYKFDINPQAEGVVESSCTSLPVEAGSLKSIMYDPPFIVAAGVNSKIGNRFSSFPSMKELWKFYSLSLEEFKRVLRPGGYLIIKCQDTVSGGKQWLSHLHLLNKAWELNLICEDIFILLAKTRISGHNHKVQKHARKFHSYFLVLKSK